MKIEEIKALAEIMTEHGLTDLKIHDGDWSVHLEKHEKTVVAAAPAAQLQAAPSLLPAEPSVPAAGAAGESPVNFNNLKELKSPMVGTFYDSPSPEADPFVKIGSKVKKGDVLCIIEAMKLLNEITAEADGEIVDICVNNGDIVEYGQVLYKIF